MRSPHTTNRESPHSLQPEKACMQQRRPMQPKIKQINMKITYEEGLGQMSLTFFSQCSLATYFISCLSRMLAGIGFRLYI